MKLFYYKAPQGNVGDDLNEWLWPKILSKVLDDDRDHLLIGIGTLLNHKIPPAKKYTVLTTGVGYGELPDTRLGEWSYVGLRGPWSKNMLGVKEDISLLDGAYLLPEFLPVDKTGKHACGYIPHVGSIINGLWEDVTDTIGMKLIDPRWPVEKFVRELCSCKTVITEAMHGAIIADAYGIHWQPAKAYDHINEFKWKDWGDSFGIDIHFSAIPPTWKGDLGKSLKRRAISSIKRLVLHPGYYPRRWSAAPPKRSSISQIEQVAEALYQHSIERQYYLTNENIKKQKTDRLREDIHAKLLTP